MNVEITRNSQDVLGTDAEACITKQTSEKSTFWKTWRLPQLINSVEKELDDLKLYSQERYKHKKP